MFSIREEFSGFNTSPLAVDEAEEGQAQAWLNANATWFSLRRQTKHPTGLLFGAAGRRNGPRAIGVGLTLPSAVRQPRECRAKRPRMRIFENIRKNQVALG